MIDLDSPEVYRKFDPSGMWGYLHEFPQRCWEGWQRGISFPLPPDFSRVERVVFLGMGGSAICGDLLGSLLALEGGVLLLVHRDYDLPRFVDERTLVIASSYSGNTEETISSFAQALGTPSKKLVLTAGGKLRNLAEEREVPVFTIDFQAPPRAALGYSFLFLVGLFQRLGFLRDQSGDVAEMMEVLSELSGEIDKASPLEANRAKRLATRLFGRVIVVYGAGMLSEVARRWKTQFNENSKSWSFFEVFPELDHNSIVGYNCPRHMAGGVFVIMLSSPSLHSRTLARYKVTGEILAQYGVGYEVVASRGETPLSQMMSLVLFGDYVSYYLAILYETDPSPVRAIDYLKERLSRM